MRTKNFLTRKGLAITVLVTLVLLLGGMKPSASSPLEPGPSHALSVVEGAAKGRSLAGLSGWTAAAGTEPGAVSPQAYTLTGHVYRGQPYDTSTPVAGVTVGLWGDEDEWPEAGFDRVLLVSTVTNASGAFSLSWTPGDTFYDYLHVIEEDPPGTYSTGARPDDQGAGYVKNFNVVSFLDLGAGTYTAIGFWDQLLEESPDLVITDVWNEDSHICYQIRNVGDAVAPEGHYTALFVDDDHKVSQLVPVDLEPGERWRGCFDYEWECTPPEDSIAAGADHEDSVAESDETNNRREESWKCDTKPPEIISGPTVLEVTQNSAVIFWETDEDSDSVVRYGKTARLYASEETDSTLVREHSITLTNLEPSTTYNFMVQSTDPSGNTVESKDFTFETMPLPDDEDPIISMTCPPSCEGVVTISATATDNMGVERVEFYLDDKHVFTDYSASSPKYQLDLDTTLYENRQYLLKTIVYDTSGRSSKYECPTKVYNLADESFPSITFGTPYDGEQVQGKKVVIAWVKDDTGVKKIEWFIDGKKLGSADYPGPQNVQLEFSWDTRTVLDGWHRIGIKATDKDKKANFGHVDVKVKNGTPPKKPDLVVAEHKVFRHGNTFAIKLTVKNQGKASASNIKIRDFLEGFQPISKQTGPADYVAEFTRLGGCLKPYALQWDCLIKDKTGIPAGGSSTYGYAAVPMMVYPGSIWPSIGKTVKLSYEGPGTTKHEKTVPSYVFTTTATPGAAPQALLVTAYGHALKEADYLIVTDPHELLETAYAPIQDEGASDADVNKLLSDMAELAFHKNGALGYLVPDIATSGQSSGPTILMNRIKQGGDWAKKLHPNFSKSLGGYLLIVGGTSVVPSWSEPGFNEQFTTRTVIVVPLTDQPYANTTGSSKVPHLIVGRIIGGSAKDLSAVIKRSISGNFDRSHALLVSGTGAFQDKFVKTVNDVGAELKKRKFNVDILHWNKYTQNIHMRQQFKLRAKQDKDVICFSGHGAPEGWSPAVATSGPENAFPLDLGKTNPFIFALACNTGHYTSWGNVALAFFDSGAAVYIGATEYQDVDMGNFHFKSFFKDYWDASKSIGKAFAEMEKKAIISQGSHSHWGYWAHEYNLYGDPKFGAASSQAAALAQEAQAQPVSSLDVVIPDYEVSNVDGVDYVEIPGGNLLLERGQLQVPFYSISLDYPQGYKVQDVVLTGRSGLVTDTGLNIPTAPSELIPAGWETVAHSAPAEDWFPAEDYRCTTVENPDGTTSLVIVMYPFNYNPLTTDVKFYKDYSFDISYTVSPVVITNLDADKDEYEQGETLMVNIEINNSSEAQDVIVKALVKVYSTGEIVDGLLLRPLKGLTGLASFSPQWNSDGFEPGYYTVEVELKDAAANLLDRRSEMFRLGISSGEITSFSATPEYFDVGDSINISLVFSNTGTVNVSGTAVIKVQNEAGETVQEFRHDVTDLASGNAISFDDVWDTSGEEEGTYRMVGYVLYDSMASTPMTAVVSTSRPEVRIYLPIVLKSYP